MPTPYLNEMMASPHARHVAGTNFKPSPQGVGVVMKHSTAEPWLCYLFLCIALWTWCREWVQSRVSVLSARCMVASAPCQVVFGPRVVARVEVVGCCGDVGGRPTCPDRSGSRSLCVKIAVHLDRMVSGSRYVQAVLRRRQWGQCVELHRVCEVGEG